MADTLPQFEAANFDFGHVENMPDHVEQQPVPEPDDYLYFRLEEMNMVTREKYMLATRIEDFAVVSLLQTARSRVFDRMREEALDGGLVYQGRDLAIINPSYS